MEKADRNALIEEIRDFLLKRQHKPSKLRVVDCKPTGEREILQEFELGREHDEDIEIDIIYKKEQVI